MILVQVLPKGRFGEMISFEFHLKNWHEKTQKPLWFLGFQPRYLFRCYLLVAGEGLEPTTSGLHLARLHLALPVENMVVLLAWSASQYSLFSPLGSASSSATGSDALPRPNEPARRAHNPEERKKRGNLDDYLLTGCGRRT